MKRPLTKEDPRMTNKHMKWCSTSLDVREMEIKTIVRYHCIPIGTAKMTRLVISSAGKDGKLLELSYIPDGDTK